MSAMGEIAVTIRAVNEATPEFEAISSDAARMGDNIASVGADAAGSFGQVGVAATEMSTNVEAAATSFDDMSTHAEATMVSLRTVAGGIRSFSMMGMELTTVATDFGILDRETAKYVRGLMAVIMIVSTAARMYSFLTLMTTGHTAALAVETTTETGATVAETSHSVAHGIYAAACNIATMAENALNISHATFLALTGVGIGVIIAAAVAISYFASQMNQATESVKNYNTAAAETPARTSGITRAQEQSLSRKGVEP
jgi:hypothetical protein